MSQPPESLGTRARTVTHTDTRPAGRCKHRRAMEGDVSSPHSYLGGNCRPLIVHSWHLAAPFRCVAEVPHIIASHASCLAKCVSDGAPAYRGCLHLSPGRAAFPSDSVWSV